MSAVAIPSSLAIHELSALIAYTNSKLADPTMHFPDILPPPTENLAQVMDEMIERGYNVGRPAKFTPSRRRSYTEWHVPVSKGSWSAVLAFFVEVQAC